MSPGSHSLTSPSSENNRKERHSQVSLAYRGNQVPRPFFQKEDNIYALEQTFCGETLLGTGRVGVPVGSSERVCEYYAKT